MVDNHIDKTYPISISHIPNRYSYRFLIDARSPISISHIDLPYRYWDHILSLWAVQVDITNTRVESALSVCNQRLKLK
jgi:hypothetical protein